VINIDSPTSPQTAIWGNKQFIPRDQWNGDTMTSPHARTDFQRTQYQPPNVAPHEQGYFYAPWDRNTGNPVNDRIAFRGRRDSGYGLPPSHMKQFQTEYTNYAGIRPVPRGRGRGFSRGMNTSNRNLFPPNKNTNYLEQTYDDPEIDPYYVNNVGIHLN
jgi:hypothetical protein